MNIQTMYGLGDNIFLLPIIEELTKSEHINLMTPWPNLYLEAGLTNINFYRTKTRLRTQIKNEICNDNLFNGKEKLVFNHISYRINNGKTIIGSLCEQYKYNENKYFLNQLYKTVEKKKRVLIRPCTVRKEWRNPARNCKPEYIQHSIDLLNSLGYKTILVADIINGIEDYVERPLRCTDYIEKGELKLLDLINLARESSLIIGPVGFIVPLSVAVGTNSIIIHGGQGKYNHPNIINCPGLIKPNHILPLHYCMCVDKCHKCKKDINIEDLNKAIYACTNN